MAVMIPAHPLPPEPVTSVPMDTWRPPQPPDLLSALADIPMSFWRWLDSASRLPHWLLPVALGCYLLATLVWVAIDHLPAASRWWTTNPKDTSRVLLSDLRKDSEVAPAEPDNAPRSDRWWQRRYCGLEGVFYGTVQQEAEDALAHEAVCWVRPGAPTVRRCPECAAPIDPVDPVDDLLDGLFEDDDAEPGLTGWQPGTPPWGTRPLLEQENRAQAELFRQMLTDALRRSKGGPVR